MWLFDNKLNVLREAKGEDKHRVKFKVAITVVGEIPRIERKTLQKWMTEDILDLMEKKRRRVKYKRKKMYRYCVSLTTARHLTEHDINTQLTQLKIDARDLRVIKDRC